MDKYRLGIDDPQVIFDNGTGDWSSIIPTITQNKNAHYFIIEVRRELINSWLATFFVPNAVENLEHYLSNTGETLHFSEQAFMNSSYCKAVFDNELRDAKLFCETLKPNSRYKITSTYARHGDVKNAHYLASLSPANRNIFYSLGGFRYWGKASVDISQNIDGEIIYSMNFTFILKDCYNWNLGEGVRIMGKTWSDANFAYLKLYGLARDFNITGTYNHRYCWSKMAK